MITKISMNKVASYKNKTTLETDKRVNLIYGLNGTGKSTLSNFLYDTKNQSYKNCSVTGIRDDDELLVYNTNFVKEYFYESDSIKGIFTLSKKNSENVAKNKEYKVKYNEEKDKQITIRETIIENEKELKDNAKKFEETVWQIKKDYYDNSVFKFCFEGVTVRKQDLVKYLLSLKSEPCTSNIEQLRDKVLNVNSNNKINSLKEISVNLHDLENHAIFNKSIVGNENSSVSDFINELKNSAWVKEGINFLDSSDGRCPFCQQKIEEKIVKDIKDYFNKSYENDLEQLNNIKNKYNEKTNNIVEINDIINNEIGKRYLSEINEKNSQLKEIAKNNTLLIEKKISNPSITIKLAPTDSLLIQLNNMIKRINEEIEKYNSLISDRENELIKIKREFWNIIRNKYANTITQYLKIKHKLEKEKDNNERKKENNLNKLSNLKKLIQETGERESIRDSIKNINNNLISIGITDFKIVEHSEEEALYCLKRDEVSKDVFMSLSEGEKMIISFLYFVELCKGSNDKGIDNNNRIIVIDDPISSLSHIYVFNVGRIIHNEFLRSDKYEQIFILTHSLYFFYELVCMKKEDRDEKQKLFRIEKNSTGSCFMSMKYNEVQNDYQEYWEIIKNGKQHPALIANCMRNIIEFFFNFVEKIDLNNVFNIKELRDDNRFQAFYRYMNRESHSKGSNIFDIKEFDYSVFKEAFELVFKSAGYEKHYKKMMK